MQHKLHPLSQGRKTKGRCKRVVLQQLRGLSREITTEMLQGFLSDAKVKPKTVYNLFITFKLMWKTAKAWGYVDKNVCEGVVRPKMNAPDVKSLAPEQMKQIIVASAEPW